MKENLRSDKTADERGDKQRQDCLAFFLRDFAAIGDGTCQRPRPKSRRAGGIRGNRSHVSEKQSGKSNEAAASGNRIKRTCEKSGKEKKDGRTVQQVEMVCRQFEIVSANARSVSCWML